MVRPQPLSQPQHGQRDAVRAFREFHPKHETSARAGVAGILSGVLLLIVLTGAGIGAVFALFPGFQIVLKAVGSAYMLGYEYGDTDLIYMPGAGSAYFHDTAGASP